jgi:DNA-binding CsgD family transcriptional regulator
LEWAIRPSARNILNNLESLIRLSWLSAEEKGFALTLYNFPGASKKELADRMELSLKDFENLVSRLRRKFNRRTYHSLIFALLSEQPSLPLVDPELSPRKTQIVNCLAMGRPLKGLSENLGINHHSILAYLEKFKKQALGEMTVGDPTFAILHRLLVKTGRLKSPEIIRAQFGEK